MSFSCCRLSLLLLKTAFFVCIWITDCTFNTLNMEGGICAGIIFHTANINFYKLLEHVDRCLTANMMVKIDSSSVSPLIYSSLFETGPPFSKRALLVWYQFKQKKICLEI